MKVIDILNKIANGEIPKRIIYDDKQWTYDEKIEDYITYDDSRIDWKYTIMEYINEEVEILDEDKKIEEIKSLNNVGNSKDLIEFGDKQQLNNHILKDKINELVREVNRIKEIKGE